MIGPHGAEHFILVINLLIADLLPNELWCKILTFAVGKYGTLTYRAILLTSRRLHSVAQLLEKPRHKPLIYLSPYHVTSLGIEPGDNMQNLVSYRDILDVSGMNSGVSLMLPQVLDDSRLNIDTTVLELTHKRLGWFHVEKVTQTSPESMNDCECLARMTFMSLLTSSCAI